MKTKEQIYDEQISPLMQHIIDICKNNGIAMLSSYMLTDSDEDRMDCTTHLPDQNGEFYERFANAFRIIRRPNTQALAITIGPRPAGRKGINE